MIPRGRLMPVWNPPSVTAPCPMPGAEPVLDESEADPEEIRSTLRRGTSFRGIHH